MIRFLVASAGVAGLLAQTPPGAPEDNGLIPKTDTIYINRKTAEIDNINNNNTESLGVAIANGGNVIVGWEDDGDGLQDIESVWTMFDSAGNSITPDTETTSVALGGSVTTKFLSYFRADGSAVHGWQSWGPKIKANLFGDGVGMGATSFGLDQEVPALAGYYGDGNGDYPTVQLLSNTGQPIRILVGVSEAFATRDPGNIRIGDWEYLSNGNVVIFGESRQNADLVDVFGGSDPWRHVIFRILDPAGNVVKAETLASQSPNFVGNAEMWHGAGATENGFAVRYKSDAGRVVVRMFDNAGNPTTDDLELAVLTGHPEAGGGGRGDSAGFHGNGKDAYVAVCSTGSDVWLTVLNANGTVRYSKAVATDLTLASVEAVDAAIDPDGNVIVVFSAKYDANNAGRIIMGRRFDAAGNPVGGTFYVSEKELPDPGTPMATGPRVAWRAGQVAVVWESTSDYESIDPFTGEPLVVVAMRLFSTFNPGSIEAEGLTRIVPDTPVVKTSAAALGNWEPYASVLGTSTFLIEANTFADDEANQRFVVALQPAAGGTMKLGEGFYGDNGQPYRGQINLSRQNGNPGRVAGDTRPGAVNFMVGGEASPHGIPAFQSDNRWNLGFDRGADGRYGTVQSFSLDPATLTQTPLTKAMDSAHGRRTSGAAPGAEISRFGGDIVCLDNGNFVSVVEDRSRVLNPDGHATVATIFAPNGTIVKESFLVAPTPEATDRSADIWSNVAPFKGGFAVRAKLPAGNGRAIYFFDNAGNFQGMVDQAVTGAAFDTGRGDGTRIFGHINSPYVYLAGRPANTQIVKVAAFDARTRQFLAIADVNEGAFTGNFDRVTGAVDALNRLTVCWVSQPVGYEKQQVAARVMAFDGTKFTPLTRSFFPFINNAKAGIRSLQMSVAMTTRQICVAAKGEINYENRPELGPNSPNEVNFYTVFSHPAPADDPTTPVGGGVTPKLSISRAGNNVTLEWDAAATGWTLESAPAITGPWTTVGTQNPTTVPIGAANQFFRLKK
ncbi:MAG: hypothetical protein IPM17_16025 [Verrucomicrobia bacterium]|nr:hypothetical protein [Verrucomicrobiota bacterium]